MLSWRDAPLNAQIGVDLYYLFWSLLVQSLKHVSLLVCLGLLTPVCHAQSMPITSRPQAAMSPIPEQLRVQLMLSSAQINDIVRLHEQYRQESGEVRARLATLRAQQLAAAAKQPGLRNRPHGRAGRALPVRRARIAQRHAARPARSTGTGRRIAAGDRTGAMFWLSNKNAAGRAGGVWAIPARTLIRAGLQGKRCYGSRIPAVRIFFGFIEKAATE